MTSPDDIDEIIELKKELRAFLEKTHENGTSIPVIMSVLIGTYVSFLASSNASTGRVKIMLDHFKSKEFHKKAMETVIKYRELNGMHDIKD